MGVRIPKTLLSELGVGAGAEFDVVRHARGTIVLKPLRKKNERPLTLEDLVAGITPETLHDAVDKGAPIGRERVVW